MLKRLIEVALPLKEVSEQSAREKSIRHGHISTLHIWWARRPLAACRAVVFASLIPDPDDPECPEHFRQLVRTELGDAQFKPRNGDGGTVEDTPRNRCLEFIKHLVRWENSNEPTYIDPARKLIKEAHKILNPDSDSDVPKVLDPFAGGGAIPLEALRLGCEAHAIELNPVAHLIELCTLVYPQKFGKPLTEDKPIPDYIERLVAHNRSKGKDKSHATLFEKSAGKEETEIDDLIPNVEITEAEYRKNPLAADVKYWGNWVHAHAKKELEQFYPPDKDGSIPVAYLWARTVKCPNPACGATIPLVRQFWLYKKKNSEVAMRMTPNFETKKCVFKIMEGKDINFKPEEGTIQRGNCICPFCKHTEDANYLRRECEAGRMKQQLMAVMLVQLSKKGKKYREGTQKDEECFNKTNAVLIALKEKHGKSIVPDEIISLQQPRLIWVTRYGIKKWAQLFNSRQLLALVTLAICIRNASQKLENESAYIKNYSQKDSEFNLKDYISAITSFLTLALGRVADHNSSSCVWNTITQGEAHTFGRQGVPMVWDYVESNILHSAAGFAPPIDIWLPKVIKNIGLRGIPAIISRSDATKTVIVNNSMNAVITDPPYYDAVPYADLSDFFYVWHKQTLRKFFRDLYATPLTPKKMEIIEERPHSSLKERKDKKFYQEKMRLAFLEMNRIISQKGLSCVMFAHKSTAAWEVLIKALIEAGLIVTASWPLHTEKPGRLMSIDAAALASSVTLICTKREVDASEGFWDDVRQELRQVANERLDFFWNQGIRGADFFISAIGPALSVFGKYEKVKRLSGEELTVGQFLDEVRSLVTGYALNKIIKSSQTGTIDPETRFYVVWKWSYSDAKVPADEAFKMAQALGLDTEMMWDRTGTLQKSGQNVQAMPITKRMSISNLGEPETDSTPGSIVDVLHRMCSYRDKGDTVALTEFLARSGHGRNETLWLVAQAISEILPDGDKEKQLLQGLLNQRDGIMEAARDAKSLF